MTGDKPSPFTGLAQAPEANLFVGASGTSIPIDVPPSRKNVTPKLALSYTSSGGASPYGYGWDLPLGKIQRSTKYGVPCTTDAANLNEFVLVLPGATAECKLEGNVCKPHIEEAFVHIEYDSEDNKWTARDKSGIEYIFGDSTAARVEASQCSPAFFSWALTKVQDTNDNTLTISYQKWSGVLHPDKILYGGNASTGLGHLFEIQFSWVPRPATDMVVNGAGGFFSQLTKRLSAIEVRYPAGTTNRIRWYSFEYEDPADRIGRQTFLSAVTVFDNNNQALARIDGQPASTIFQYHQPDPANADPAKRQFGVAATEQTAAWPQGLHPGLGRSTNMFGGLSQTHRDIFDINGDGIADLVDTSSTHGPTFPGFNDAYPYWDVYLGTPQGFSTTKMQWAVPILPGYWTPCWPIDCWNPSVDARSIRASFSNGSVTPTYHDTIDMNGDGIPDFVDSAGGSWSVFFGQPSGGFGAETSWPGVSGSIRESRVVSSFLDWEDGVSLDTIELLDMNGDGLPDRVVAGTSETATPWTVYYNTGSGFGAGAPFNAPFGPLRATANNIGLQFLGFTDINGDGLPDHILAWDNGAGYDGSWHVYYHTGESISYDDATWALPASSCSCNVSHFWNGLRQTLWNNGGSADVVRDFFDINGDGLPDVVDTCPKWQPDQDGQCEETGATSWTVYLNQAGGFSSAHPWESPRPLIRNHDDHVEPQGGITYWDTFDVDGDGASDLVDFTNATDMYLYHNLDGAWKAAGSAVEENRPADVPQPKRTDLLEVMENGLGTTTTLEYRPSTQWDNTGADAVSDLPFNLWTVTRIDRDDGMCDSSGGNCIGVSGGAHALVSTYRYQDGRFDPIDREFRGFALVQSEDRSSSDPLHRATQTQFQQGWALKGKVQSVSMYQADGGTPPADFTTKPLTLSTNTWECRNPDTLALIDPCPTALQSSRVLVRLTRVDRSDYTSFSTSNPKTSTTRNLEFDQYGNVTHTSREGTEVTSVIRIPNTHTTRRITLSINPRTSSSKTTTRLCSKKNGSSTTSWASVR